jgi:hypothetical protein
MLKKINWKNKKCLNGRRKGEFRREVVLRRRP